MNADQDIINFRRDFVIARKVIVGCGNIDRSQTETAWDFIHRLDPTQYGGFQQFINNQIAGGALKDKMLTFDSVQKLANQYKVEINAPVHNAPQISFATEYEEMKDQLLLFSRKLDAIASRAPNSASSKEQISFATSSFVPNSVTPKSFVTAFPTVKIGGNPQKGKCGRYGGGNFCRASIDANNSILASHDDAINRLVHLPVPTLIGDVWCWYLTYCCYIEQYKRWILSRFIE